MRLSKWKVIKKAAEKKFLPINFIWEASTENEKLDQVATSPAESIRFVSILDFRRILLTVEKDF